MRTISSRGETVLSSGMPVSDRDIDATALQVLKRHGASAAYYAASRADELLAAGDLEGARTWRRILAAIERMQEPPSSTKH